MPGESVFTLAERLVLGEPLVPGEDPLCLERTTRA